MTDDTYQADTPDQWYVIHLGQSPDQARGPFTFAQIQQDYAAGIILETDMVMSPAGTSSQWVGMAYLPNHGPFENPSHNPQSTETQSHDPIDHSVPPQETPPPQQAPISHVSSQHEVVAYQEPQQQYSPPPYQEHAQQNYHAGPTGPSSGYGPYQPPQTNVYIAPPREENILGLLGFIFALLGLATGGVLTLVSLVLCIIGLGKEPKGLAMAGLIINLVMIGIALVIGVIYGLFFLSCCCFAGAGATAGA